MNENVTQETATQVAKVAEKTTKSSAKTGLIIGGVAAVVAAIAGITVFVARKKSKKQPVAEETEESK